MFRVINRLLSEGIIMYKNEIEIDVFRCFRALFKRWKFIAAMTALFLIAGCGYTINIGEDMYSAVATVYAAAGNSYSDAANAVTAMNAYLDVANTYKVSQRAALIMGRSDVDVEDIQAAVNVSSSARASGASGTISNFMTSSATIISFTAITNDPELSMAMANAVADSYTIEMANILKTDAVKNLDSANEAVLSVNAMKEAWKVRIIFMLVGFIAACLVVVLCEILDRKVRTIREATIRGNIPVIGMIPDYKE